jgi:hypothetical protein
MGISGTSLAALYSGLARGSFLGQLRNFTFSNAQKSEKMDALSQPLAGISLAQRPTTHYFTFSLFHPPASSKIHIVWPNLALRASHALRS